MSDKWYDHGDRTCRLVDGHWVLHADLLGEVQPQKCWRAHPAAPVGPPGTPMAESVVFQVVPPPEPTLEQRLNSMMSDLRNMMMERHRKYGPGNIAEFGELGILVRMADKFARLKAGQGNFDDETVSNTLDDIIGYALIWKLWLNGHWPGSTVTFPVSSRQDS